MNKTLKFQAAFFNSSIDCDVVITNNWQVDVSFTFLTLPYVMMVTADIDSFLKALRLYITQTGDDAFGNIESGTQCIIVSDRELFALALANHVMSCLNTIMTEEGLSGTLPYASWFLQQHLEGSYSSMIQAMVCQFILLKGFLRGSTPHKLIGWAPEIKK